MSSDVADNVAVVWAQVLGRQELAKRLWDCGTMLNAEGDGDVLDGLDVVLRHDVDYGCGAGGDSFGSCDADDTTGGRGGEDGEGGGEDRCGTHFACWLCRQELAF